MSDEEKKNKAKTDAGKKKPRKVRHKVVGSALRAVEQAKDEVAKALGVPRENIDLPIFIVDKPDEPATTAQ